MSDLISRQAAIDAIDSVLVEDESCKVWFKLAVKNLPSAQPEKRTETHACDLIDREAAVDAIYHHLPSVSRTRARTMLHEVPSAQPEIIQCKDCKHVGTDATCCLVCNRDGMGLRPFHVYHDDFCSYAERRTDE